MFFVRCLATTAIAALALAGCKSGSSTPTTPTAPTVPTTPAPPAGNVATIRIVYVASTTIRTDLPDSALGCARAEAPTHVHVSWLSFQSFNLNAATNQWELTLTNVPINTRHQLAIADPNVCVENMTGSVTRNVLVNDVRLTDVQTIPNTQPAVLALAFSVASDGRVSP